MSLDVRTWRLKIEALLLPTPLAELDPDGETARVDEVRRNFALPAPSVADVDLLKRARADAGDAQAAGAPGTEVLPTPRPDHLLHPLDPTTRWDAPARSAVDGAWRGLLERVREIGWAGDDAAALAGAYRRLWWEFAGERVFQRLPHTAWMPDHSLFAHRSLAAAITGARAAGGEAALMLAQTGPVQETIEASRRTSDLWMGSFLYSYLSYHALAALVDELGPDAIISPHPRGLALAEMGIFKGFGDKVTHEQRVQPSLPAKVLAVVPLGLAKQIADDVSKTILETWQAMAGAVRGWVDDLKPRPPQGWDEGFGPQIDAAVERGVVVLPWPKDVEWVRGFVKEVWWGSTEGASAGALYGPMSGVLWRLSSAAGRASLPARCAGDTRRKCTVCGEREQMGPVPLEQDSRQERREKERFWARLAEVVAKEPDRESIQLKDGEGLCAVCLTRRFAPQVWFGGDGHETRDPLLGLSWDQDGDRAYLRFPSVASVAAAPFRKVVLAKEIEGELGKELKNLLHPLGELHAENLLNFTSPGNLLPGLASFGRSRPGDRLGRQLCDYDGTWMDGDAFEPDRAWRDHFGRSPPKERAADLVRFQRLAEPLRQARDAFGALCKAVEATPSAYYAVLYLDGDQMSHWLNGIHDQTPLLREVVHPSLADRVPPRQKRPVFPALQSELSRRLSSLAAGEVAKIVHAHLGRLVYCGGDDVVALLPLITALPCAEAIYKLLQSDDALGQRATASAGLVFAHWRDPLGPVLRAARTAEKAAKENEDDPKAWRDRLCLRVETRSGAPLDLILPWALPGGPGERTVDALIELVRLKDKEQGREPAVSLAFGYDLRAEADALRGLPQLAMQVRLETALKRRLPKDDHERVPHILRVVRWALETGGVDRAVNTILFARFLAREARGIDLDQILKGVR